MGSQQYDAFGNVVAASGWTASPNGYGGPFGYQEDPDSGLKLLGHRYYDPDLGRFLSRDPIQHGRNWYVYCDSGPLSRADPLGLAYMVFDGRYLYLISDDGVNKRIVKKVRAYSGKPGATNLDTAQRNSGPIPEGLYSVDEDKIAFSARIWIFGRNYSAWNSGFRDSWGEALVPADPKSGTDTYGRNGFHIHGGKYLSSAGCIDIGPEDEDLLKLIRQYSNGKPMTLYVGYPSPWKVPGRPGTSGDLW